MAKLQAGASQHWAWLQLLVTALAHMMKGQIWSTHCMLVIWSTHCMLAAEHHLIAWWCHMHHGMSWCTAASALVTSSCGSPGLARSLRSAIWVVMMIAEVTPLWCLHKTPTACMSLHRLTAPEGTWGRPFEAATEVPRPGGRGIARARALPPCTSAAVSWDRRGKYPGSLLLPRLTTASRGHLQGSSRAQHGWLVPCKCRQVHRRKAALHKQSSAYL